MKCNYKLLLLALPFFLFSCKKKVDPPENTNEKGTVSFKVENVVGAAPLVLNAQIYANANGDSFSVTRYAYFLSNLELINDKNESFKVVDSHFLVDDGDSTTKTFSIADVPAGNYVKLRILLGVDSATNLSGAQTGDLDPATGMYWGWNTGYINAKFEGRSPQSGSPVQLLNFDLGGYSGPMSTLKTVELTFPQTLKVSEAGQPVIHLKSNILEWFNDNPPIDFQTTFSLMTVSQEAYELSVRYQDHLSVSQVEN